MNGIIQCTGVKVGVELWNDVLSFLPWHDVGML
jgi:hypothetical protein